ncbi:MAG: DUF2892 domain-containing protein [Nitrospirota bacterium]
MKKNIGNIDRTLRLIGGAVIVGLGFYYQSWLGAIGIIPLFTALVRWCPLYTIFGLTTCRDSSCSTSSCCSGKGHVHTS